MTPIRTSYIAARTPVFAAALVFILSSLMTIPVRGTSHDYTFHLIEDVLPVGNRVEFSVRIIDEATGEAVTDAMVFANRIDMTPDGRPDRDTHLAALASNTPGIYRYRANLVEAGNWQLTLMVMIPGAEAMVEGRMFLRAISGLDISSDED